MANSIPATITDELLPNPRAKGISEYMRILRGVSVGASFSATRNSRLLSSLGTSLPRMHGFEAEGAAAIVKGAVIEEPETIATAIRIGNPASWKLAEAARDESKGFIDAVTDEEILNAYRKVAAQDGVFIEPGSAASLAGVIQHVKNGKIRPGETVVAVFTGNGLKDPDTAIQATEVAIHKMSDLEEMRQHLRKGVSQL